MTHASIVESVEHAISELGFGDQARRFSDQDASRAAEAIARRFVNGSPAHWWDALSGPHRSIGYARDTWKERLENLLPKTGRCWLMPEFSLQPTIYELNTRIVCDVLRNCEFFEYYLVDPALNWLIADTHHNTLVATDVGS